MASIAILANKRVSFAYFQWKDWLITIVSSIVNCKQKDTPTAKYLQK